MDNVDLQEMFNTLEDYLPAIGYELESEGSTGDSADAYRKRWALQTIEASIATILDNIQLLQAMENDKKGDE